MTTTAIKERPILMNGDMVRAVLAGRKTHTRRIVKPQPKHRLIEGMGHVTVGMDPADDGAVWYDADGVSPGREVRCPCGRVGERLWVRETWNQVTQDGADVKVVDKPEGPGKQGLIYRATNVDCPIMHGHPPRFWRPSIHMPRWASRITLEITGVRVERLNDISEEDALAEGIAPYYEGYDGTPQVWWQGYDGRVKDVDGNLIHTQATGDSPPSHMIEPKRMTVSPHKRDVVEAFRLLWQSIYGDHSWWANPWVWVVEFKLLTEDEK